MYFAEILLEKQTIKVLLQVYYLPGILVLLDIFSLTINISLSYHWQVIEIGRQKFSSKAENMSGILIILGPKLYQKDWSSHQSIILNITLWPMVGVIFDAKRRNFCLKGTLCNSFTFKANLTFSVLRKKYHWPFSLAACTKVPTILCIAVTSTHVGTVASCPSPLAINAGRGKMTEIP